MQKTVIKVQKMDCPSEIKIIEGLIEGLESQAKVEFDLGTRTITVYHEIEADLILHKLKQASLPGIVTNSEEITVSDVPDIAPIVEANTLKALLAINFVMFLVEVTIGVFADSTGLIADGLDMLADSFVYLISLFAVGASIARKNKAAFLSGVMQISLGVLCLIEVGRKYFFGSDPLSSYMIAISLIALVANLWCLMLIYKHRDGEVHMRASWIFSANDVIVNLGVIISGVLVYLLQSSLPDLLIGGVVSMVVIKGGVTIIKMSKSSN